MGRRGGHLTPLRRPGVRGRARHLDHTGLFDLQVTGIAGIDFTDPGVSVEQLAEDRLWACFIADGHHVPRAALRVGLRAKGWRRSILVSGISRFPGLPDGEYEMEGRRIEKRDGGVFVKGSPLLWGASRTLDEDVALLARDTEPGIERCLLMAGAHPTEALGEPGWAEVATGRRGPLVAFSWDGRALAVRH